MAENNDTPPPPKTTPEQREYHKKWYLANRAKIIERSAEYHRTYPEQAAAASARYRQRNPEKVDAYLKQYREEHREEINARNRLRRSADVVKARAEARAAMAEWRAKNRAKHAKYMREFSEKPKNRLLIFVSNAKKRANARGLEFDDSLRRILKANPPTECRCCHVALDYSLGNGHYPNGPSLDRIDPSKGYTVENVAVLCFRCNTLKRDATLQEVERILAYMRSFLA